MWSPCDNFKLHKSAEITGSMWITGDKVDGRISTAFLGGFKTPMHSLQITA